MGGTTGGPKNFTALRAESKAKRAGGLLPQQASIPTANGPDRETGLSAGTRADLDRLAHGMTNSITPGPVVTDIAGALRSGGDTAREEARYLIAELDRVAPEQARNLRSGLVDSMKSSPDTLRGVFPEHQPPNDGSPKDIDAPATQKAPPIPSPILLNARPTTPKGFDKDAQASMLNTARFGELTTSKNVIKRIQSQFARDDETLDRLDPELRSFYNAYQMHLRRQPYTTDTTALANQERNALIAGREAMGATKVGPAFAQGAVGTIANMISGAGQLAGNKTMIEAGKKLQKKIEKAFPVPDHLRDTGSISTASGWGELAPAAALGAGGLARKGAVRVGAAVAAGAAGAGKEATKLARQGASVMDQRIGAFVGAVSEGVGPKGSKIAAKQGTKLLKKHLGLDLANLPKSELEALNSALAPQGVRVLANGIVHRTQEIASPDTR